MCSDLNIFRPNLRVTYLSFFGLVLAVLGEEVGEDVAAAGGHVDERAFLAERQAGRHSQHHTHRLDD